MLNVYFKTINATTSTILEELRNKRYREIKCWFKRNDEDAVRYFRDLSIIQHTDTDGNLTCYNWDINQCQVCTEYDGLEHLVWRSLEEGTKFVCIDDCTHCNNQLVLFQDAPHEKDYPKGFVKVPCFHTLESLMDYVIAEGIFHFTLKDTNRFDKCSGFNPIQGASVYKEKATGYYWYMDMLHKNHYEVFDATRKHIGEADLNGELNRNLKVAGRTI